MPVLEGIYLLKRVSCCDVQSAGIMCKLVYNRDRVLHIRIVMSSVSYGI